MKPPTLLNYVRTLQDQEYQSVGFLTTSALREYHQRRQIIPAFQDQDPCGYMIFYDGRNAKRPRNHPAAIRIRQIAIEHTVRRVYHGTGLISRAIYLAQARGFARLELWCAIDLPAMKFWRALGFTEQQLRIGGSKDNRIHALWTLDVPTPATTEPQTTLDLQ